MIFMFLLLTCLSLGDLLSVRFFMSLSLINSQTLCVNLLICLNTWRIVSISSFWKSPFQRDLWSAPVCTGCSPDLWVYSCWCKDFPSPSCLSLALNPWFVELLFLTFLVYLFIWWSLPPRAFFQKWYMGDKMSRGRSGFILY